MMAPCMERDWAKMPSEILGLIVDKVLLEDFIRFGAVCKPWLSVTIDKQDARSRSCCKEPPMLFIPPWWNREHDKRFDERYLHNIFESKTYRHSFCLPQSNHNYTKCKSSSGWWISFRDDLSVELLNPFSKKSIILPSLSEPGHRYDYQFKLKKVILSCNPSVHPNDWVAAAIGGLDGVSLISTGNLLSWRTYYDFRINTSLLDVCFYKDGLLFVLDYYCRLFVIKYTSVQERPPSGSNNEHGWKTMGEKDENGDIKETTGRIVMLRRLISDFGYRSFFDVIGRGECYLVVMEEELLMVVGYIKKEYKVYKCSHNLESITTSTSDVDTELGQWIQINDLGKYSLFVGLNQAMCICASDFPNCQPNCIYYIPSPNVSFDLNVVPHTNSIASTIISYPPVWISPTLQKIYI